MISRLAVILAGFWLMTSGIMDVSAQTQHAFSVGAGSADVMDTYLSPLSYDGINFHAQRETRRKVRAFGLNGLTFQTLLDMDASILENPAGNVNEYAGGLRYALGWTKELKRWKLNNQDLIVDVGPMVSGYAGTIYNERNGNNPAQAKVDIMIDLTAHAKWDFNLFRKRMSIDYQIVIPFVGMAFSPNYGQSYYEMFSKGNYDNNVVFANFVNMPSTRHQLNLDVPLRKSTRTRLRISYLGSFMQSKFNKLRYHSYTNTFMIGMTKYFKRL